MERILRYEPPVDAPIVSGDLLEIFVKGDHEKRSKWSYTRTFLKLYPSYWTVTVPDRNGRTMKAAIEEVRQAPLDIRFANMVSKEDDKL